MTEEKSSYRQLFKATTVFGGVQILTIVISIIRSKFIAVLLGPTGMGIVGLLNSTTGFIDALTNFGIERSAVKNIAVVYGTNDPKLISKIILVLRRLVWGTGLLGALITLFLSSYLSKIAFGNEEYTFAFIWLSVTLLLTQLTSGEKAVLRGLRKIKFIAKTSLWGALSGLIVSIPLYYFFSLKGIVPAIILTAITTLLVTVYYSRKISFDSVKIKKNDYFTEGKDMLKMGFFLSLSSLIALGASYLVRIFIRYIGTVDDVGFYSAGFAIVNAYFGVFFTSLTTDYYPRLASVASDNNKARILMNQQSELSVLIIAPVLTIFLIFINAIVIILYSKDFVPINDMILWASLGIYFKAASYALGIIFISKGDVKTLFWSDLLSNIFMFGLNLIGFKYLGLEGLGISFLISFIFMFLLTFFIVRFKYSFYYSSQFFKVFFLQLSLGIIAFILARLINKPLNYYLGVLVILISVWYSIKQLDRRMGLLIIAKKFISNKLKS